MVVDRTADDLASRQVVEQQYFGHILGTGGLFTDRFAPLDSWAYYVSIFLLESLFGSGATANVIGHMSPSCLRMENRTHSRGKTRTGSVDKCDCNLLTDIPASSPPLHHTVQH